MYLKIIINVKMSEGGLEEIWGTSKWISLKASKHFEKNDS